MDTSNKKHNTNKYIITQSNTKRYQFYGGAFLCALVAEDGGSQLILAEGRTL